MTATPEAQAASVLAALESAGWIRSDGAAVASKPFDTVNGENNALAYLTKGDGFNRTLQFNYVSEGRNVAAADGVLIPVEASEDHAAKLTTDAAARAEKSIKESYGVRIEAMRPEQATLAQEDALGGLANAPTHGYSTTASPAESQGYATLAAFDSGTDDEVPRPRA